MGSIFSGNGALHAVIIARMRIRRTDSPNPLGPLLLLSPASCQVLVELIYGRRYPPPPRRHLRARH
jgi:hypothetical protein